MSGQAQGEEVLGEPVGVERFEDGAGLLGRVTGGVVGEQPPGTLQTETAQQRGAVRVRGGAREGRGEDHLAHGAGRGLEAEALQPEFVEPGPVPAFPVEQVGGQARHVLRGSAAPRVGAFAQALATSAALAAQAGPQP
ncbi:hypothetical protein [Streptomyces sp. NPDC058755]|uniref:hypothetical protein n=1 Tax=Streptomyces sp. NPDC058755 TaxID=3346624 RepID=UPI00368A7A6D